MSETATDRKTKRRWPWVLVALPALLLAAVSIAPRLIDPQRFLPQIERALEDATGWEAQLGSIEFSLLRGALSVSPANLSAPGGDTSALEIERIDINVKLLPLFRKQLQIDHVRLVRPAILLVKPRGSEDWVVPEATAESSTSAPNEGAQAQATATNTADVDKSAAANQFQVRIDAIEVHKGSLRIEDRSVDPALALEATEVTANYQPSAGHTQGRLELSGNQGTLRWDGKITDTIEVTLDGLHTELLEPFLGADLIHGGGLLSGQVAVEFPLRLTGTLTTQGLTLLSGTRPLDAATLEFVVSSMHDGIQLERLAFRADDATLSGSGPLTPTLALKLELPTTDLDAVIRISDSIVPFPIEVRGPGSVAANIRIDQPPGGLLTYEADGRIVAAEIVPGEMLPAATNVDATFVLDRKGRLELALNSGAIAGGQVTGGATLDSVDPPGQLRFTGGLSDAVFGQLLGGLVRETQPVTGPTGFSAALGVDLSRETLDARSLSGRVDFNARALELPGWDLDHALRARVETMVNSGSGALIKALLDKNSGEASAVEAEVGAAIERLIDGLKGSIDFDRWPWGLEQLALEVGDVQAQGSGTFDAETGAVAFALVSHLSRAETTTLVAKHKTLKVLVDPEGRLTVPITIGGSLLAPSIKVDLDAALKGNLLGSDKPEVENLLKGLLNRRESKKKKQP